ncbi:MAG: hypothetical protein WC781_05860 [Candidatus Pacearchaeota archaeon]|jgi:hypothetical protein
MKIKYIFLILIVALLLILIVKPKQEWIFDKIVGQTIYFSNDKQFKIDLYDLKYIGQLQIKNKTPYFILAGRSCQDCDENISINIYSPYNGLLKNNGMLTRYSYPGKEYDYIDHKLLFESRMFYGNCFKKGENSVVWVQKQLNDENNFEANTFILEIVKDNIQETILKDDLSLLDELIKNCNELSGIESVSEP